MIEFYPWQLKAFNKIKNKNAIISSSTGSGKSYVSYLWAGILDEQGNSHEPENRLIITSPIKSLSNERYLDIKRLGLNVGLETGDFKKNTQANILCMTQEIYTLKYADKPNQNVIIDEFHYIFRDPERSRAYIDGIVKTHNSSKILMMSATFGDVDKVKTYLEKISQRNFTLFTSEERAVELVFLKQGQKLKELHDCLIFAFSVRDIEYLAENLSRVRKKIQQKDLLEIEKIANILQVNWKKFPIEKGIGVYYGQLLPKEKMFIENIFRRRLIDIVIGTDALSLGVNLPAETVVFGQLAKRYDGIITKNEFLQMAGRAGRKGFFETGYVTFLDCGYHAKEDYFEFYDMDNREIYASLLKKKQESANIRLQPDLGAILRDEIQTDIEVRYVCDYSLPEQNFKDILIRIRRIMRRLALWGKKHFPQKTEKQKYKKILGEIWSNELSEWTNFSIAALFVKENRPNIKKLVDIMGQEEKNRLMTLLRTKCYANRIADKYSFKDIDLLDVEINLIDHSVFNFEDLIKRLENEN